jgi:diguanylate cyclase (GGDEF)-like protein
MSEVKVQTNGDSASIEQQIRKRIESLSYLPTTVAVAMKFIELGKNPDAEPSEYAKVISSDSSLASKLLALANSSWFGVRNKVTKPQMAVNLLGLGTVRTLAISYCLTGLHNELRLTPDESRMFWSASLCKAVAAKQYALHFEEKNAEEAFTAALFTDFALPVMFAAAKDQILPLIQDATIDRKTRLERERATCHLDHAEIGRIIAQKLELPDVFVDAVAFHHNHDSLKEFMEHSIVADAVYAASLFPHSLNAWNPQDADELRHFIAAQTASKPLDVNIYLDACQKEFNQLYAYFESGGTPELKLADLLEVATREAADNTTRLMGTVQELMREAASAGKEMHQILSRQTQLEQAATRDPLTGALNREGFTQRTEELIAKASRYGIPFGVLYLDLDHFKTLNDTLGHSFGDAALQKLVAVVQEGIRPNDFIGRLGGDEFVVILSECDDPQLTQIAERLVSQIAAVSISRGKVSDAHITVSAGLLAIPPRSPASTLENLIHAADELMYQSKRTGGNRVTHATHLANLAA